MAEETINIDVNIEKVNIEDNVATITVGKDTYLKNLPDGITKKMVKQLENYNVSYIDAVEEAVAKKAVEVLKENKDVDSVVAKAPFGTYQRDKIITTVKREAKFPIPGTDQFDTAPRITSVVKWHGAKASRSKHKELLTYLKEQLKD